MLTALLLPINIPDFVGVIFTIVWLLLLLIVSLLDYGFKHGWFIQHDNDASECSQSEKTCP